MSTVYNLEPNPTAKVLLQTTAGDLELELFAKQTPRTSRNFLQLCLDGYYDNTIFHRLVPEFIVQGGDPTGTGEGGESSYDGEPFEDEFHSRLKFNRRGLLGMANTGKKNDNGSQFFLTLGNTPELQGKNTMFGRIVGDTIYNLMKIGEADLAEGSEDRPMYPAKITGTEIIINPFEDMVKRVQAAPRTQEEKKVIKKPKRKAGKALLSFGDNEGEEDWKPVVKKAKFNTKLISAGEVNTTSLSTRPLLQAPKTEKPTKVKSATKMSSTGTEDGASLNNTAMPNDPEKERSMPIRKQTRKSRSPSPPPKEKENSPPRKKQRSPSPWTGSSREPSPETKQQSLLERTNAQIEALKASMRRNTGAPVAEPIRKKSALEAMIPETSTCARKRGVALNASAEKAALDMLSAFKSKLESAPLADMKMVDAPAPTATANDDNEAPGGDDKAAPEEEEEPCDLHFIVDCQSCKAWDKEDQDESDDDVGWMNHKLSFAKDRLGKDLEWKRKNEEELVVIDPREKARELKEQSRGKKDKGKGRG